MDNTGLPTVRSVMALRTRLQTWRQRGDRIALVPTRGSLHEGHASLVRLAKAQAERVVCAIVRAEDPDPAIEEADARLLASERCDLIYAPGPEVMRPAGFATRINVGGTDFEVGGEGADETATRLAKLLIQASPDVAVFGEKNFAHLQVARRLAADLDLPVQILSSPTVRAPDGLAVSSRNAALSEEERPIAGRLNLVLKETAGALARGADVAQVEAAGRAGLLHAGFGGVDYFEARASDDLRRLEGRFQGGQARVFAAARLGSTRLVDNWPVG